MTGRFLHNPEGWKVVRRSGWEDREVVRRDFVVSVRLSVTIDDFDEMEVDDGWSGDGVAMVAKQAALNHLDAIARNEDDRPTDLVDVYEVIY